MYTPISIKEAVNKVNNGWYLPAIQRPYVWGNRYESETHFIRQCESSQRLEEGDLKNSGEDDVLTKLKE